jgi:hypothetical protein
MKQLRLPKITGLRLKIKDYSRRMFFFILCEVRLAIKRYFPGEYRDQESTRMLIAQEELTTGTDNMVTIQLIHFY